MLSQTEINRSALHSLVCHVSSRGSWYFCFWQEQLRVWEAWSSQQPPGSLRSLKENLYSPAVGECLLDVVRWNHSQGKRCTKTRWPIVWKMLICQQTLTDYSCDQKSWSVLFPGWNDYKQQTCSWEPSTSVRHNSVWPLLYFLSKTEKSEANPKRRLFTFKVKIAPCLCNQHISKGAAFTLKVISPLVQPIWW